MNEVFIVGGVRTPFGRYRGALGGVRPDDLLALTIRGALSETRLPAEAVDEVIVGCANQAGEDNRNVARMGLLLAGLPVSVPGYTVNRLCASGLTAITSAYLQIVGQESDVVLAGGVESMSRAPWVTARPIKAFSSPTETADSALGWRFINPEMAQVDEGNATVSLGETAERVAELSGISRQRSDAFAVRSHERAVAAQEQGDFDSEIIPVMTEGGTVKIDEGPRIDSSPEAMGALAPVFRSNGIVTAGSASPLSDGAAAVVVASRKAVERWGLTPVAVVRGSASAGVAPSLMGLGPVAATERLLNRVGFTMDQIDVMEINEAFAPQVLACLDRLGVDEERVNLCGGAIALGHPLGASGTRLTLTAVRQLQAGDRHLALVTLCVGVGQGTSLLLEKV